VRGFQFGLFLQDLNLRQGFSAGKDRSRMFGVVSEAKRKHPKGVFFWLRAEVRGTILPGVPGEISTTPEGVVLTSARLSSQHLNVKVRT